MLWNIDPVILQLGPIQIRYYGVFFFVAVMVSVFGFNYLMEKFGKVKVNLDNFFFGLVISSLIGGRLFYFLFSGIGEFLANPAVFFNINHGGNSSIGTLLFTTVFFVIYAKKSKSDPILLADHLSVFAPLSASMIRLGNFFNSEIVGTPTSMPWSVTFIRIDNVSRHPVQLYEFFLLVIITFVHVRIVNHKGWPTHKGTVTGVTLFSYFGFRFFLEYFKDYTAKQSAGFFSTTQWFCLGFAILGCAIFIFAKKLPTKRDV